MSLALELQARGHEPVIATMENYREKVANAGFSFAPVRPDFPHPKEQDPEMIEKILQPMTGAKFLVEEIIHAALRDSYFDLLRIVDVPICLSLIRGACRSTGRIQDRYPLDFYSAGSALVLLLLMIRQPRLSGTGQIICTYSVHAS
jgi:hypothetical protein